MDNHILLTEPKKDTVITSKRQVDRSVVSKAIYMITDFFADNEPLKFALRTSAVEILKDNKIEHVLNLKKLLTLSRDTGLVSEDNTNILIKGIDSMQDLESSADRSVDIKSFITSSFNQDNHNYDKNIDDNTDESNSKTHKNNNDAGLSVKERINTNPVFSESLDTVKNQEDKNTSTRDYESFKETSTRVSFQKPVLSMVPALDIGARRKKILEIVKSKGQVTIHEFIQSIQGCSSKTIQRELTSLVLSGTLKKTGERRWSKYSIR